MITIRCKCIPGEYISETEAVPLISVKVELAEERSDLDNHIVNAIDGASLPASLPPLDFTQRSDDRVKSVVCFFLIVKLIIIVGARSVSHFH